MSGRTKLAELLPDVKFQEHQQRIHDKAEGGDPLRLLLMHALGSGKSLTSIGASEGAGLPTTTVVPASLRENYKHELNKFTTPSLPRSLMSYTELAQGKPTPNDGTVIFDEAQRLRNVGSKQTQQAMELAQRSKNLFLLSGTPIVNEPADLAPLLSMLSKKQITPQEFTKRYVGEKKVYPTFLHHLFGASSGSEPEINHRAELKALLKGHVDYYSPDKPVVPVNREDHHVDMSTEQTRLYKAMWGQLPWYLRWKLKHDYPLSREELMRTRSFLTGPRQVGLSTMPYLRSKDPHTAFQQSPKLQLAHAKMMEHLNDPRTRGLIFSNFIDAGLTPYAAALTRSGMPNAVFHGGLSDIERKKLVEDYNSGKIRAALLGPSGTEGLSFKGTNLIQILDPYWNPVRGRQSEGRGLRFDSHTDLPEELKHVKIQRFIARLPLGFKDRLLSSIGFNKKPNQYAADDYLRNIEARKDLGNRKFVELLKEVGSERT